MPWGFLGKFLRIRPNYIFYVQVEADTQARGFRLKFSRKSRFRVGFDDMFSAECQTELLVTKYLMILDQTYTSHGLVLVLGKCNSK